MLPKTLKIRNTTYKVKEVKYIDDTTVGAYDSTKAEILVRSDLPDDLKFDVFVYEALHAVYDECSGPIDEEQTVNQFTSSLIELFNQLDEDKNETL